jgi:endonuclease/exonuclease/phosphatase family metal-dependent hydrolase
LITELVNGGRPLVVYNLHLESKLYEHLRLLELNEVLADVERCPPDIPVIIAGDFNRYCEHPAPEAQGHVAGFAVRREESDAGAV